MTGRHRRTSIWIGAAAFFALLLVAVVAVAGSSDSACASCHSASAEGLSSTSHAEVTCYSCHAPGAGALVEHKVEEIFGMYPGWVIGRSVDPGSTARVADSACISCHPEVVDALEPVVARGIRIVHAYCAEGSSCDSCHAVVGHGAAARSPRSASMGRCVACHTKAEASIECESCHTEGYERNDLLAGPFRVTHGENWRRTHGMGDLAQCVLCHQDTDCAACHGPGVPHVAAFGGTHGETALTEGAACDSCHRPEFCSDCHQIEMPHPASFLPEHSSLVSTTNDPACIRCHTEEDCQRCHQRHIHPGGATEAPGAASGTEDDSQ